VAPQGTTRVAAAHDKVHGKTMASNSARIQENELKRCFADDRWKNDHFYNDPHPQEFSGPSPGLKKNWDKVPNMLQLFGLFWTFDTLRKICVETNRYAQENLTRENENGELEEYSRGGPEWYDLMVKELKVFIVIKLYMGLKKLPQVRFY
jgi:hypothetical protein